MLLELFLISGGAALWQRTRQSNNSQKNDNSESNNKILPRKINPIRLIKDFQQALNAEGRHELQLDIDPELRKQEKERKRQNTQQLIGSTVATGLALLGAVYPVLSIFGALGILYLSREWIKLAWSDLQRFRFLSLPFLGMVMTIGTIAVGQLLVATIGAVVGNFFARIVNNLESSSQQELVRVFGGHPEKVWLLKDGTEIQIDFHSIQAGDIVVVNAGEVIPVDGTIQTGEGQIDQHLLTGESQPAEKSVGEPVFASTILLSGRLAVEVEMAGDATVAAKIGTILNSTQSYKDTLMNRGRQIADRFLPITASLSLLSLPLFGPRAAIAVLWSGLGGLMALLGPLSVLSYLQILSRNNILVKDGRVFESLRKVDTVVFDKTGTLTLEQPTVAAIHVFQGFDEKTVLRFAAAAEYRQPHPIAKAILEKAHLEKIDIPEPDAAGYEVGYGIKVTVENVVVRVGSARFLQREEFEIPAAVDAIREHAEACSHSLIFVGVNDQLAGVLEMQPTIRPEAGKIIHFLKQRGMELCIISGDHEGPTQQIAQTLGIERYFAEVLPENKASLVQQLREEGRFVCFIGDGINDAIALKSAQVSISLKGASSAATDTAQIIFMDGSLNQLVSLFEFVDEFEVTMGRNLAISIIPGLLIIGGVYMLHFGIAMAMTMFYAGTAVGLGNVMWPLLKHQDSGEDAQLPPPDTESEADPPVIS